MSKNIGFFIPVPAILISLSTEDNRYSVFEFPPHSCIPGTQMWFYSIILPIDIFSGIGVCFMSYLIWTLNKVGA